MKNFKLSVSQRSLYVYKNVTRETILYITQKSATETSGELETNSLTKYHSGAVKYQKKYSQNHLFISFWLSVSSARSSIFFDIYFFMNG